MLVQNSIISPIGQPTCQPYLVQESYARILEERKHAQHPPGDALRPTSSTQKSSKASSKIVALDALEGEVR